MFIYVGRDAINEPMTLNPMFNEDERLNMFSDSFCCLAYSPSIVVEITLRLRSAVNK